MKKLRLGLMGVAVSVLSACGGGGDDAPAPSPGPVTPTTTSVPVTVIDGRIGNAQVCLDKNDNGRCDDGEPTAQTDTNGMATLTVDNADLGKYSVLALATTASVDADHGPVLVPFAMKAPADQPGVVSPLTTLVQAYKANSGASTADAEAVVKAQTGITVSLFQDFTTAAAKADSASVFAGDLARLVVLTTQKQTQALASTVGSTALDGTTIQAEALTRVIEQKLLEILPSMVQAVVDAAAAADKNASLGAASAAIVASPATGIDTASVAVSAAANNQLSNGTGTVETPAASLALRQLSYTNASNWFLRSSRVSIANAVLSNGMYTSAGDRQRMTSGSLALWGIGRDPRRNADLHFNGTAWVGCGFPVLSRHTPRDASGHSSYNLCDGFEVGSSSNAAFDISGRTMIDVYQQIAGYGNISIDNAAAVLGATTFPTGSMLRLTTDSATQTAVGYYPGRANQIAVSNAAVAAGKTSASDSSAACAAVTASTPVEQYQEAATTLDMLVQRNAGTPCVYGEGTLTVSPTTGTTVTVSSGPRNDWFGQSALALEIIGTAATGGLQSSYYTTNTLLRVAFAASGDGTTYYACQQRSSDGSPRNCNAIGTGTYRIASLGDGRVLSFTNMPALVSALGYEIVFVERGGYVYMGYQNKKSVTTSARLTKVAANALLGRLGIDSLDEEQVPTTTPGSFAGNYDLIEDGVYKSRYFVNAAGQVTGCPQACTGSVTADGVLTVQQVGEGTQRLRIDFLTGNGVGTFTPESGPVIQNKAVRR
jgi:hypothetical protein